MKLVDVIILNRLSDILEDLQLPDVLQTAYQKGLFCSDAVSATQEALIIHLRESGHPYLCLFDQEKAFDSIELSVLLKNIFNIGINPTLTLSPEVLVKQGSPILFLVVIDQLLKTLRDHNAVYCTYIGGAAHADDVHTITASIAQQVNIIKEFAAANHLKLNSSKTEVIKISCYLLPEPINLSNWDVCSKCYINI